jgi:hypothetical protein
LLIDFQTYCAGVSTQVIPDQFDSRKVPANGATDHSAIHIIKNPCQVLPYCVITLEVNTSSGQYILT